MKPCPPNPGAGKAGRAVATRPPAPAASPARLLSPADFRKLQKTYLELTGFPLVCVTPAGAIFYGRPACRRCAPDAACCAIRRDAVAEALRWGEPCLGICPAGFLLWAVPLMLNDLLLGGLVVVGVAPETPAGQTLPLARIRAAIAALQELAERRNLLNGARMLQQRLAARRERDKAEAIHTAKNWRQPDARLVYLREEPALLTAVRDGDAARARSITCRILAGMPPAEMARARNIAMELAVMCYRAALEAGGDPAPLAGALHRALTRLPALRDQAEAQKWVDDVLAQMTSGARRQYNPHAHTLERALEYLRQHLDGDVTRDSAARAVGMSPSHFSHMLTAHTGQSFTKIMTHLRVDRARELLARTDKSLVHIAFECGFSDQSYFSRVFRKTTGATPADYRRRHCAP